MSSMRAGDWQYEAADEAEPYEAADPFESSDPFEAADPYEASDPYESDEAEYEPEYDPYRGRPQRQRSYTGAVRGVQTAVVRTPSGNANIQLPSRVPTVQEFRTTVNRVQRDVTAANRRTRTALSLSSSRAARAEARGARSAIWILVLEQFRDVLKEVGTNQIIQTLPNSKPSNP